MILKGHGHRSVTLVPARVLNSWLNPADTMSLWNSKPTQWPLPRTQELLLLDLKNYACANPYYAVVSLCWNTRDCLSLLPCCCWLIFLAPYPHPAESLSSCDITLSLLSCLMLTSFSRFSDYFYQPFSIMRWTEDLSGHQPSMQRLKNIKWAAKAFLYYIGYQCRW